MSVYLFLGVSIYTVTDSSLVSQRADGSIGSYILLPTQGMEKLV